MGLTKQQITMVVILMAGALLVVLNQTLLTPALPTIMSHLDVNATTVQWLTSGYSLVEAVIIPLNAFLLGRFSTRKLFIGGLSLFTIGSVLCACAPSFAFLMLGRICQASATGVAMPTVFALILLIFPKEKRGAAMGIIGLVISFAPAVGPSISGVLVDSIGWRALFVLVAFLAVCVVIASCLFLKNFEGFDPTTLDVPSIVLLAVGMISLLYGISVSTSSENLIVPVSLIVIGLVVMGLFVRRQLRLETPILSVRVLQHREFRVASVVIVLLEAILIGSSVMLPLYIQNALGQTATVSGLLMLPGSICGALCGLLAGNLFDRFGIRGVSLTGVCILIAGVAGYFAFTLESSLLMVGIFYAVASIGIQSLITPVNTWGINSLPNRSLPHGNAIVSTLEQVGASLGTAFTVSLTALSSLAVAADAPATAQSIAGDHFAFAGLLGLAVAIGLVILFFMRDKKPAKRAAGEGVPAGVPGVDREWLVYDFMNAASDALSDQSTVKDAVVIMQSTETGGLPIVNAAGAVVGFVSDGDILKRISRRDTWRDDKGAYRLLFESEELQKRLENVLDMQVMDLATKNVVTVNADDDAEKSFKMLAEKHIDKVPVLADGAYVATLSRRNVINALPIG